MVKEAAAATLSDLSVGGLEMPLPPMPPLYSIGQAAEYSHADYINDRLTKLLGRTAAQHAFHLKRTNVHQLDSDLAGYRSFSLAAKIRTQRERDYWRSLEGEKGWLEATMLGWLE
jgi:hypothetical protein